MLPERFDLHYIDEDGLQQRPVAIHRAIYGSLERFIGVITEHFAGAFPLWLAPVQAVVIPIADRHLPAAEELAGLLRGRGLRVEVDGSDNRMQNKIRLAQGRRCRTWWSWATARSRRGTASPRTRAGEQQPAEPWDAFADRLAAESRVAGQASAAGAAYRRVAASVVSPRRSSRRVGRLAASVAHQPGWYGATMGARELSQMRGFSVSHHRGW